MSDLFWMPCTIEASGFSSERRFEVDLDDAGKVVGVAYIKYFCDENKKPIEEGHPPFGQTISGFVQCRVVKRQGDQVFVEFPSTDIFHVPQEALASW
jgi:hypothetical protein